MLLHNILRCNENAVGALYHKKIHNRVQLEFQSKKSHVITKVKPVPITVIAQDSSQLEATSPLKIFQMV